MGGGGASQRPARRPLPREARWGIEALLALGIVTGAVWICTGSVAIPWTVSGPSMEPTLRPGDRVIVDLFSYRRRPPRAGEVALFAGPRGEPLIKRVASDPGTGVPAWALDPEDRVSPRFWVLGDNLRESADSRLFGPVPVGRFRGRVVFRFWPLRRFGLVRQEPVRVIPRVAR